MSEFEITLPEPPEGMRWHAVRIDCDLRLQLQERAYRSPFGVEWITVESENVYQRGHESPADAVLRTAERILAEYRGEDEMSLLIEAINREAEID